MKRQKTNNKNTTPKRRWYRRLLSWLWAKRWLLMIIIVASLGGMFIFGGDENKRPEYSMVNISRGDLRQVVTATGEIQPVNTVSVGSQVSGTIDNLYVDFNSTVEKGDVLLTIEPSVLQASVDEAKAALDSAISQRNYAKNEYTRNQSLYSPRTIFGLAEAEFADAKHL